MQRPLVIVAIDGVDVATAVVPDIPLMSCRSAADQSSNQCNQIHCNWV